MSPIQQSKAQLSIVSSTCANCSSMLRSPSESVSNFKLPNETKLRSVYEMVELVFNGREVTDPTDTKLRLCSPCGAVFAKVLTSYLPFLGLTSVGSYIYNVRKGIMEEVLSDKGIFQESDLLASETSEAAGVENNLNEFFYEHSKIDNKLKTDSDIAGIFHLQSTEVDCEVNPSLLSDPLRLEDVKVDLSIVETGSLKTIKTEDPVVQNSLETLTKNWEDGITLIDETTFTNSIPKSLAISLDKEIEADVNMENEETLHQFSTRDPPAVEYMEKLKSLMDICDYKCDSVDCAKNKVTFTTFRAWVIHQERMHEIKTGYDCEREILKPRHLLVRPCPVCGKMFKRVPQVRLHLMMVHLNFRPFQCGICRKRYSLQNQLIRHHGYVHPGRTLEYTQ